MEKAWFMVPVENNPDGKDIMTSIEYTHIVYRNLKWKNHDGKIYNGKIMVL